MFAVSMPAWMFVSAILAAYVSGGVVVAWLFHSYLKEMESSGV